MEEFLKTLTGKKIDAFCGGPSSLRGKVVKVEGGVLHLQDDAGDVCYVAVEKVVAEVSHIKMRQSATVAPVADCCMEENRSLDSLWLIAFGGCIITRSLS